MADTNTTGRHSRTLIDDIDPTTDKLTGRAGLSLFTRYLRGIEIFSHLDRLFGSLRQSGKGQPIPEIFKQLFCFFLDGTSRHLVYFDALKQDEGYAGAIETGSKALLSSHAVKRFSGGFYMYRIWLFRRLLQQLFLWRLRLEQPPLILLGLDTMVMDNDEAEKRHGAAPTYKRVKGFQPLQVTWDRYVIGAVFRGGDKHSNHSDTAPKTLRHLIQKIRRRRLSAFPVRDPIKTVFKIVVAWKSHGADPSLKLHKARVQATQFPGEHLGPPVVGERHALILTRVHTMLVPGHQTVVVGLARCQAPDVLVHLILLIIGKHGSSITEGLDLTQSPVLGFVPREKRDPQVTCLHPQTRFQVEGKVIVGFSSPRQGRLKERCIRLPVQRLRDLDLPCRPGRVLVELHRSYRDWILEFVEQLQWPRGLPPLCHIFPSPCRQPSVRVVGS